MTRFLIAIAGGVSLVGSLAMAAEKAPKDKELRAQAKQQLGALPKKMAEPANNKSTPEKVALGKMLFFEPRISLSQSISCNSCHNLAAGGTDNLPTSIGHEAKRGGRNSPTVLNAGFQFVQFWDGRTPSLEAQAVGPITNPVEMAMPGGDSGALVLKVLRSIPQYQNAFAKVFGKEPEPLTMTNIGRAIAAFERTLVSRGRFDRYLEGDNKALNDQEKRGLAAFLDVGCAACHGGPTVGGQMFQKVGAVKPWPDQHDQGRYEVTKDDNDRMMFKVPVLRNIARTAPYFHEGDVWTLDKAIVKMAEHQLGRTLEAQQVADIKAFLQSLDGAPMDVMLPKLPPSADDTPPPAVPVKSAP